jgi:tetratricopeptide (TPR) repeat protein
MISTNKFLIKVVPWVLMSLLLFSLPTAVAGTFMKLEPGVSTKTDVDRILGRPTRVIAAGERYDYEKEKTQTRRISVQYYPKNMVVQRIDVYPIDSNTKAQYKSWLGLKQPQKKSKDMDGNLVEYYAAEGIALHCDGPDDTAAVRYFSHFDPAAPTPKKYPPKMIPPLEDRPKDEEYYVKESDKALEEKNWARAKNIITQGLQKYPDYPELLHSYAAYYLKNKNEPLQKRIRESKNSMYRAYKLKPSGEYAAEMGWLHWYFHNDCILALSYYEEAEQKGLAKEKPGLLYWMGNCYEKAGMYTSAKTYYRRFLNTAQGHKMRSEATTALDRLKRY